MSLLYKKLRSTLVTTNVVGPRYYKNIRLTTEPEAHAPLCHQRQSYHPRQFPKENVLHSIFLAMHPSMSYFPSAYWTSGIYDEIDKNWFWNTTDPEEHLSYNDWAPEQPNVTATIKGACKYKKYSMMSAHHRGATHGAHYKVSIRVRILAVQEIRYIV